LLGSLKAQPHILSATIFLPRGGVFSSYQSGKAPPLPVRDLPEGEPEIRAGRLLLSHEIRMNDRRVGVLWIQCSLEEAAEMLRFTLWVGLIAAILAALVALLLSSAGGSLVSAPILHLAQTAEHVSLVGDYRARAPEEGNDEVGMLIRNFNEML